MNLNVNYYEQIFERFKRMCPTWGAEATHYVPKYDNMIRVYLRNGDCVDYNDRSGSFRYITKDRLAMRDDITDEDCREIFSRNLYDLIHSSGINQEILSERTGISTSTISKYIKKKATPTMTSIKKIAHAMKCSVDELTE